MKLQLLTLLILVFCLTLNARAQHNEYQSKYIFLEDGFDQNFYSGSSFGTVNPLYSAFPVTGMIRHNRVDGVFIGYQEDRMKWSENNFLGLDNINIHGLFGYAVARNEIQYMIGADKRFGDYDNWFMIGGEYHNTTSTEDYWRSGIYENAFSSFTAGFDFHDYYKVEGFGFYTLIEPFTNVEMGISYHEDEYSSLQLSSDFALFTRYADFRFNPAIDTKQDQINQKSITLALTINPGKITSHSSVWSTFSFKAELAGLKKTQNDFMYNRYQAEAKTFLRLDRSSLLKWRVMAGTITGDAPDFKTFALGGIGTMRAMGYKVMQGNEMLLSNLEIELGKNSAQNHDWVDLSSLYLSFFLDSGWSGFNKELTFSENLFQGFQTFTLSELSHNVGAGIGIGLFRIEVAKPVSGTEGHSVFWIRFNPAF